MSILPQHEIRLRDELCSKQPTEAMFILQARIDKPYKQEGIIDYEVNDLIVKHTCKQLLDELLETNQILNYKDYYYKIFKIKLRDY